MILISYGVLFLKSITFLFQDLQEKSFPSLSSLEIKVGQGLSILS